MHNDENMNHEKKNAPKFQRRSRLIILQNRKCKILTSCKLRQIEAHFKAFYFILTPSTKSHIIQLQTFISDYYEVKWQLRWDLSSNSGIAKYCGFCDFPQYSDTSANEDNSFRNHIR